MRKNKIILFDIDYTLFDADKFRVKMFEVIKKNSRIGINNIDEILRNSYIASRKETGYFKLKAFLEDLATKLGRAFPDSLEKAILKEDIFTGNLYKGAKNVLHSLSKNKQLIIGIFSGGDDAFQRKKIEEIKDFFYKEHTHIITVKKNKQLPSIIKKYKRHNLYIVDDNLEILHAAKSLNKNVFTVWIKRRRYDKIQREIPGFTPDATIENLKQVVKLVAA